MSHKNTGPIRSSVHIARLLDGESYTEEIISRVKRWQRYQVKSLTQRQEAFEKINKAAGLILGSLPEADKKTVGKFIAMMDRMSFEAGLKIGLTVGICEDYE